MLRKFLLLSLVFCGCGFRVEAPQVPINQLYLKSGRVEFSFENAWWRGFQNNTLEKLVLETLADNNDLKSALMRRESVRKQLAYTKADLWPSTQVRSGAERSEISAIRVPGIPDRSIKIYDAGVSATWEVDLWGALRSRVEGQRQALQVSESDIQALRMSLAADAVRSFVAKCAAEQRIKLLERAVDSERAGVRVLRAQYRAGVVGDFEYRDAEADLQTLRSSVPAVRAARDSAVVALSVLRGVAPNFDEALDCPDDGLLYRQTVGLDQPEALLQRRPDILAAEARLKAAVANVGDQVAQLFPKLNILGSLSFEGASFDGLVNDPTKVFSYGPTLTWRPLSILTLTQRADAAKTQADSLRYDYQSTALKAVGEVETAMGAYKAARKKFGIMLKAANAARRSFKVAESRFNVGAIDALELSRVERSTVGVELDTLAASEELTYRLTDLVLALGVQA